MTNEEGGFALLGEGVDQFIGPGHRAMTPDELDQHMKVALNAGEHYWVVTIAHEVSQKALRANVAGEGLLHLDAESIIYHGVGCFSCETPFHPGLLDQPCPGEPNR